MLYPVLTSRLSRRPEKRERGRSEPSMTSWTSIRSRRSRRRFCPTGGPGSRWTGRRGTGGLPALRTWSRTGVLISLFSSLLNTRFFSPDSCCQTPGLSPSSLILTSLRPGPRRSSLGRDSGEPAPRSSRVTANSFPRTSWPSSTASRPGRRADMPSLRSASLPSCLPASLCRERPLQI